MLNNEEKIALFSIKEKLWEFKSPTNFNIKKNKRYIGVFLRYSSNDLLGSEVAYSFSGSGSA